MTDVTDLIKRLREAVGFTVFFPRALLSEAATALERLSGKPDEEAVARVIDPEAWDFLPRWDRAESWRNMVIEERREPSLTKAREIMSLSGGGSGENMASVAEDDQND